MADEKALLRPKQKRSSAKSTFTKQANHMSKTTGSLAKHKLQAELNKLKSPARQDKDVNKDYRAGLLEDLGLKKMTKKTSSTGT